MEKQSPVRRTLASPGGFARLAGILEDGKFESRSAAGRRVCEAFGFLDARGRPQLTGCLSALAAMEREHPLGARAQFGRQLRYLFGSAHGWLGGAHFASPALALAARDAWIGWGAAAREERLHLVVGLARFLIRPQVRCRNLVSMALAACMRRLAEDWRARLAKRLAESATI